MDKVALSILLEPLSTCYRQWCRSDTRSRRNCAKAISYPVTRENIACSENTQRLQIGRSGQEYVEVRNYANRVNINNTVLPTSREMAGTRTNLV
jgi:hypothetical protein